MRIQRRQQQRGSAFVVVMLFGLIVILMVGTLLSAATSTLKSEHGMHDTKALSLVLRTGIEQAVFEINMDLLAGPFDPDGDGAGALGTGGSAPNGIEVRGANGQLLGLYRTIVQTEVGVGDGDGQVLWVVAVRPRDPRNPSFVDPLQMMAAKLLVDSGTFEIAPTSALEFPGTTSPDKAKFQIEKEANLTVYSGNPLDPNVPAIKIANTDFYNAFTEAYDTGNKVDDIEIKDKGDFIIEGMDVNSPGSLGTGTASIQNGSSGAFSEETLQAMAEDAQEYIDGKVDAAYAGAVTNLNDWLDANASPADYQEHGTDDAHIKNSANLVLPDGVYEVKKLRLEDDVTITGSGTLIVTDKFELKDNSSINWTGDIIIVDDDNNKKGELKVKGGSITGTGDLITAGKVKLGDELNTIETPVLDWTGNVMVVSNQHKDHFHKAEFKLEKGGDMNVDGSLVMVGWDKEAKFEVKKDGNLTVDGALLVLSGGDPNDPGGDGKEKVKFKLEKDGVVTVNGIAALMGNDVKFEVKKDETFNVNGSMVVTISDGKKAKLKFKVDKESNVTFIHDSGNITDAAADISAFYQDIIDFLGGTNVSAELDRLAYWEIDDAEGLFLAQQNAIDAGDPLGWQE